MPAWAASDVAALTVREISKAFGRQPVLRSVDLDVADGSTLALLGPSGTGKSTLLRIVAGLESADEGTVRLGGHDITSVPAHRRGVGFVFQDQALFPHLDVAANVGFGLRMAGVGAAGRRDAVAEALEVVGLPGFGDRDPATLSGGEAQRVALARALAPRPRLVLLDEPLAALDQLLRERLLLELRSIFDDLGVTVIAVSHDPTESAALGHQLAVLVDGRIAQVGEPGDILAHPVSAAVAGLVGHRNVVSGSVADDVVTCPWGQFTTSGAAAGPAAVLVRPDGIFADPDGALDGVVAGRIFRGGSAFATVSGPGWPPLDVRADASWRVGDGVRLRIDPAAVHVMPA